MNVYDQVNYGCDECGRRKMNGRLLMVETDQATLSLCYDCAEDLIDMLREHIGEEDQA
ncbi:hypothetical protein PACILC2_21130 [Paenibacillus cisolokensis]|uniref:Inhibitor of sigma-G Gin n=1 Tax=Paenibacillus cisolokensis TaxID=1658519 RepID=A0ABQ4N5W4_9BACL|nr:hypothetical protein [Paenibacillus cisolokensis]GIQ63545.1 hypothetical protein PACILC2_21130 [Paenibacillus cisolokensis]